MRAPWRLGLTDVDSAASASGLATRCAACGTIFRVVLDQLRVSDGWVRCGRCSEVFNASTSLLDLKTGVPVGTAGPATTRAPSDTPPGALHSLSDAASGFTEIPAGALIRSGRAAPPRGDNTSGGVGTGIVTADGTGSDTSHTTGSGDVSGGGSGPGHRAFSGTGRGNGVGTGGWTGSGTGRDVGVGARSNFKPSTPQGHRAQGPGAATVAAGEAAAAPAPAADRVIDGTIADGLGPPQVADGPVVEPSFLRRADRAERWRLPRVRRALVSAASVLGCLLLLQSGLAWRDPLAAQFALLRVPLQQACALFGCRVGAARSIDDLSVESSGLVRVEKSSLYRFSVALRNRAAFELSLPALELSLTDGQGRLVARRVLTTVELGAAQEALGPGRELPLQATLQVSSAPVTGYTIELFYP